MGKGLEKSNEGEKKEGKRGKDRMKSDFVVAASDGDCKIGHDMLLACEILCNTIDRSA